MGHQSAEAEILHNRLEPGETVSGIIDNLEGMVKKTRV